jgi:hypothetical protein
MSLNKTDLRNAIKAAFKKAKETPPPEDPADTDQTQEKILTDLSTDLANAVEAFVLSGDVKQVTVEVKNNANTVIGVGTQTGVGKIS